MADNKNTESRLRASIQQVKTGAATGETPRAASLSSTATAGVQAPGSAATPTGTSGKTKARPAKTSARKKVPARKTSAAVSSNSAEDTRGAQRDALQSGQRIWPD